jgi:hypothetical protein
MRVGKRRAVPRGKDHRAPPQAGPTSGEEVADEQGAAVDAGTCPDGAERTVPARGREPDDMVAGPTAGDGAAQLEDRPAPAENAITTARSIPRWLSSSAYGSAWSAGVAPSGASSQSSRSETVRRSETQAREGPPTSCRNYRRGIRERRGIRAEVRLRLDLRTRSSRSASRAAAWGTT